MDFRGYKTDEFYDEVFHGPGVARDGAALLVQKLQSLDDGELLERQAAAEQALLRMGITFNIYGDDSGTEKIFPFDMTSGLRSVHDKTPTYFEDHLNTRLEPFDRLFKAVSAFAEQVRRVATEDKKLSPDQAVFRHVRSHWRPDVR